ncbi:MAG: carboxypeptidase-like regulatory domain-containing protein [Chitinivibrionales bacterium]|nr:carboxypeptidase-like regulatory domain-containing protein [Chitinivibrionales bacterium]
MKNIGLAFLLLWMGCATAPDIAGRGGSSETTNGVVMGCVVDPKGAPVAKVRVRLVPAQFNAVKDSATAALQAETTDVAGKYRLDSVRSGVYNIEAVQLSARTRALVLGVTVSGADTAPVPDAIIRQTGTIKVGVPANIDTANGYLYVPGTTTYSLPKSNNGYVDLDSVPAEVALAVYYAINKSSVVPQLVKDSVSVTPGGSSTIALSFAATAGSPLGATMGIILHAATNAAELDLAKADGFAWIRVDDVWKNVEKTPGVYDWSRSDSIMSLATSRGIKVLWLLCYGNSIYGGSDSTGIFPPVAPAQITAYCNYCKAVAVRFKGTGSRYEIWNEPEVFGKIDAATFGALCRAAADSVHKGDPAALVSTGGLSWFDFTYENLMLAAGGGIGCDAIAVHENWMGDDGGNADPENIFGKMITWRANYKMYLPNMNADWMTQSGPYLNGLTFTNPPDGDCQGDQHRYAYLVLRQQLCNWMVGFDMSFIYCDGDAGQSLFGTDDNFNGNTLRRANAALQTLASVTNVRTMAGFTNPTDSNGIWSIQLTGSPSIEIAWVPKGSATITAPIGSSCQDQYGAVVSLTSNGNNLSALMNENSGVYYFTLGGK